MGMGTTKESKKRSFLAILIAVLIVTSLLVGGLIGYLMVPNSDSDEIANLQNQVSSLQSQVQWLRGNISLLETTPTITPAQASNNDDYLENLTAAIAQVQSKLSSLQLQIVEVQTSPSAFDQNITVLQSEIEGLQATLSSIQEQMATLQSSSTPNVTYQNITYVTGASASLNQLFEQVKTSVVVVQGLIRQVDFFGRVYYSQVQGSGFVYNHSGRMVVLTNNHVISGAINITVTFTDGITLAANVLGSNANTDFAILSPATSIIKYKPLEIISSSSVKVGDSVIVVGTPYGLAGSMSNGIVSALNRTLSTSTNTEISNIIQTTAPLNPGNSGGPVMNYNGQVVGIATAIVQESQGIGFAIASDTILSELQRILPG